MTFLGSKMAIPAVPIATATHTLLAVLCCSMSVVILIHMVVYVCILYLYHSL